MSFNWPTGLMRGGQDPSNSDLISPLLRFLNSLDRTSGKLAHPAFQSVGNTLKRREWFLSYGTKLLFSTGWLDPEDADIRDLISIKTAEGSLGATQKGHVYRALVEVFRARYGAEFPITVDEWDAALRSPSLTAKRVAKRAGIQLERALGGASTSSIDSILAEVLKATPAMAAPAALRATPSLPGLDVDLPNLAAKWIEIEELYIRTVRRESYKQVLQALGYLNIYLFFYLPYWFSLNPYTKLAFPDTPTKLIGSVFISRLLRSETAAPQTFLELMDAIHAERGWDNNGYYGLLKQAEGFFSFLETHNADLPGCDGFKQPIPSYAYPATSRSRGTNKKPIPRRLFGIFLDYVEALRTHCEAVLCRVLDGSLDITLLERELGRTGNVIDTFATSQLVGFIPVVFTRRKVLPLRYIPNCLSLEWFPLTDGRTTKLPQPHALNQILVALYTGLRHNHIQWLDARDFDAHVTDDDKDFALLHVNTDKAKSKPWTPHVNFRVIEILRSQREWRRLVDRPEFGKLHHYNDNPSTKWAQILPLFSSDATGRPHPDARYATAWQSIVSAVEVLRSSMEDRPLQRLCSLEPPGVTFEDAALREKRREYGATCKTVCELGVKSSITPHSARVTVVSQYATLLPIETIGSHITGQSPGVVYHYVRLEADQLLVEQTHQAMALRERAYRSEFESVVGSPGEPSRYIKADSVNSNLALSLRTDLPETLVSYGCVSIMMNEDATSGLDVLRETRAVNAAENKTEICPYGNHCPPEIVKQWRGMRRCGLCQYAVRSIDHLPAVAAKVHEFHEMLSDLTSKVEAALNITPPRYSEAELDRLDEERSRIAEELAGWQLSEEVLNAARLRVAREQDNRRWVVQKPEIIQQDLQRIAAPSNLTAYVLARLGECIAFPTTESPQIRARFDILRRELLARSGRVKEAFDATIPSDPAAECAGLLRTIVHANGISYDDIVNLIESERHLSALPAPTSLMLGQGE
ncbi:hypothetical protein ACI2VH_02375 [Ralstonia nicotianae]